MVRSKKVVMSATPLLVPVAILAALAIVYVIAVSNSFSKAPPKPPREITIHNSSSQNATVVVNHHKPFELLVGDSKTISIPAGADAGVAVAKANFDGSVTVTKARANHSIHALYISESKIGTNENTVLGDLVNDSEMPVLFIQLGSEARRWPSEIIPPGQSSVLVALVEGSQWQVVNPSEDMMVIDQITLPKGARGIRFDGTNLLAETT